jgi:type II secretory pathway component GspD/PulD (secretin)
MGGGGRGGIGPFGEGGGRGGGGSDTFQVIKLKNAAAADVVVAIQAAFQWSNVRVVAEPASNSVVVVSADPAALKDIIKLIDVLDAKPDTRPGGTPGGPGTGSGGPGTGGMGPGGRRGTGSPDGGGGAAGPGGGGPMDGGPGGRGPGGGMPGGPPRKAPGLTVLTLRHATAAEIATVLDRVYVKKADIVVDGRTNQLIVRADDDTLKELEALLEKLDVQVPPKR